MASSKDRSLPAKKRVIALDERLTELRTILSERRTPVPAVPSSTVDDNDDERKIERLARMVFMALRSEPRLLSRFVHELGKLQATQTGTKAHQP